jgi:uncharacterized protein (UPF0147 family)
MKGKPKYMTLTAEKLKEIIDTKNGDLERAAVSKAKAIIDEITKQQDCISHATQRIAELRSELRQLSITQIDAASILGS